MVPIAVKCVAPCSRMSSRKRETLKRFASASVTRLRMALATH